ncbi:MAG TPA: cytochrome c biogenesis CcdA family protein, partial [Longimicrobiales bacterium]|nr:cytochrome c biogenesis CcdA family protein [Longimicrobiales bacterium]
MPQLEVTISFPLAFVAGVLSFLSPCILPVVPGYVTFVSGVTLDELQDGGVGGARRRAVLHSVAFGVGFGLVFMTLGAAATAAGRAFAHTLPLVTRLGGVVVILFALHLLGLLRRIPGLTFLSRERRLQLSTKPAGLLGSLAVGVAFGAGWSPCIGPVLA